MNFTAMVMINSHCLTVQRVFAIFLTLNTIDINFLESLAKVHVVPVYTIFTNNDTDKCQHKDIRLAGSSYNVAGLIELCINGDWKPVCGHNFDNADASVVCAHLGYSSYGQ